MENRKLTYSEALREIRREGNRKTFKQAIADLKKFNLKKYLSQ